MRAIQLADTRGDCARAPVANCPLEELLLFGEIQIQHDKRRMLARSAGSLQGQPAARWDIGPALPAASRQLPPIVA
jgi:hypothetical protein